MSICRGCVCGAVEERPLNLLDGRLVGPITTLRIRSTGGEHNQRAVALTCMNCGLISLYDAGTIQADLDGDR